MTPRGRGAIAGAAAATIWTLAEPLLMRAFGTRYSDVRLAGRLLTKGRSWPAVGSATHAIIGAGIGSALGAAGLTAPLQAALVLQGENVAAWPGMALADRIHPDRRDGYWPRLLTDRRVFAQSMAARVLFAAVFAGTYNVLARTRER